MNHARIQPARNAEIGGGGKTWEKEVNNLSLVDEKDGTVAGDLQVITDPGRRRIFGASSARFPTGKRLVLVLDVRVNNGGRGRMGER